MDTDKQHTYTCKNEREKEIYTGKQHTDTHINERERCTQVNRTLIYV